MTKRKRNPLIPALIEGAGFTLGSRAVEHIHKNMRKGKKKKSNPSEKTYYSIWIGDYLQEEGFSTYEKAQKEAKKLREEGEQDVRVTSYKKSQIRENPGSFIGVRVNGSKVQLKLPNRNRSTLNQVSKLVDKLGYKIKKGRS